MPSEINRWRPESIRVSRPASSAARKSFCAAINSGLYTRYSSAPRVTSSPSARTARFSIQPSSRETATVSSRSSLSTLPNARTVRLKKAVSTRAVRTPMVWIISGATRTSGELPVEAAGPPETGTRSIPQMGQGTSGSFDTNCGCMGQVCCCTAAVSARTCSIAGSGPDPFPSQAPIAKTTNNERPKGQLRRRERRYFMASPVRNSVVLWRGRAAPFRLLSGPGGSVPPARRR